MTFIDPPVADVTFWTLKTPTRLQRLSSSPPSTILNYFSIPTIKSSKPVAFINNGRAWQRRPSTVAPQLVPALPAS
jgi:hypothetical protein